MGIEASGRLHVIYETKQVSERFTKREFVVEMSDNPKYPQHVLFQLTGDRCNQLDSLSVGDSVRIDFSLRGREWKSPQGEVKYFNSLDAWSVEKAGASSGARRDSRGGDSRGGDSRGGDSRGGGGGGGYDRGGGGGGGYDRGGGGGNLPRGGDPRDQAEVPPRDDDDRPMGGGRSRDDEDIPF